MTMACDSRLILSLSLHLNTHGFNFRIQLFVEVHYTHPEMFPWGWLHNPHSLSDAQALFTKARDAGMYIHPWP